MFRSWPNFVVIAVVVVQWFHTVNDSTVEVRCWQQTDKLVLNWYKIYGGAPWVAS